VRDYTFVLNPTAGKGSARKAIHSLEHILSSRTESVTLRYTERPGHATEIAREATTSCVVAVGGDGTINEVVNGLIGTGKTLGAIPTGSGNDFVKSVGIPKNLNAALGIVMSGSERLLDAGKVSCGKMIDGSILHAPERYFLNGVGIGFDGHVAWRVSKTKYLRGTLAYFAAVLRTLGEYDAPEFRICVDGRNFTGRKLLIATGNGKCAGGGFYLTPDAVVDDGTLDFCMIDDVPVIRILPLIPVVMSGKSSNNKAVSYGRMRNLSAESGTKFSVHADGEVIGYNVNEVRIEVVPGAIKMLCPSAAASV
jgi:diacylglycerol kinase (ATP)